MSELETEFIKQVASGKVLVDHAELTELRSKLTAAEAKLNSSTPHSGEIDWNDRKAVNDFFQYRFDDSVPFVERTNNIRNALLRTMVGFRPGGDGISHKEMWAAVLAGRTIDELQSQLTAAEQRAAEAERQAQSHLEAWTKKSALLDKWQGIAGELERKLEKIRKSVAWHRDGKGPDVPVLQPRYDALQHRADTAEARCRELERQAVTDRERCIQSAREQDAEIERLQAELASLKAKLAEAERNLIIADLKNSHSLANNLCPDHRDKQIGSPCLACSVETLERKLATEHARYIAAEQSAVTAVQAQTIIGLREKLDAVRELVASVIDPDGQFSLRSTRFREQQLLAIADAVKVS